MDPVQINIIGIPGYVYLWVITAVALTIFTRRIIKITKVLGKAKPENRFDDFSNRLWNFIKYVLGQKRLFNEKSIGLPHFLFFWGFVFYAFTFWWNLLRGLIPVTWFPYADEVGFFAFMLEVTGALVILSIIVAVIRRVFFPPEHLQKSFDAGIILSLIALLVLSFIFGQGFKSTIEPSSWSPVGAAAASILPAMDRESAHAFATGMWWLHMATVLFFLAYIPFSKHMHLLASPFNVFFSNDHKLGDLGKKGSGDDAAEGAAKWEELTWKDLLNSFSCAECGRCDRVCPALNSGYMLSPRDILHKIKENLYENALDGKKADVPAPDLIGGKIAAEELWQCTSCMSCMQQCPVLNEHLPVIVSLRRNLVNKGELEATVQDMLMKMSRYGNSFGQSDRNRAKWTAGLDFKIKDARKEEVEYLWITGDYASFDTRLQEITRTTAKIFNEAGIDFGLLYESERNSGNDVRRIGEEGLFEILREKNIASFGKAKFQKIITTDPHTYNTLKHEYFGGEDNSGVVILHYTELIDELIRLNRIKISKKEGINVTYHDPCYLGRYNGVYDPPRRILKSIGANLTEMPRNKSKSYCCGAGGGRIWMEDKEKIRERPSENRIREAVELGNVDTFVVACPKDIVMFQDAIKTTGNENKIQVRDISELVWQSIDKKETLTEINTDAQVKL